MMLKQITTFCSKALLVNKNFVAFSPMYTNVLKFNFAEKKQEKNPLTAKFSEMGSISKQDQVITNGRAWLTNQLRIKSTEDLHKLWYVCVRQKNVLLADKIVQQKNNYKDTTKFRIMKLKKTMSRILTVINERAQIRKKYREKLQQQYIDSKRAELEKQVQAQPEPMPQITWEILRSKYQQLRRGIDNVDYLERIWEQKDLLAERKKRGDIRAQKLAEDNQKFKSFWEKQMTYEERPTQEQILRAHVTNWRQLNLKQRKIILGFLNAKRAKDAKQQLVKELKILGQKIAHQQVKQRTEAK